MNKSELTRWAAQWRGWTRIKDIPDRWERNGDIRFENDLPQVCTDTGEAIKLLGEFGVQADIFYLGKGLRNPWEIKIALPHEDAIFITDDTLAAALTEALYNYSANQSG